LDGSKNIPPHNTGAAVDIEIMTPAGKLLDMGMEAKDGLSVDPTLCLTGCQTISKTAQKNRQLLHEIMHAHGFINYPTEWWHFSYGDRYWAYHVGAKTAIYGSL
jgi:D-alanyl-D-alanine dipeptidase